MIVGETHGAEHMRQLLDFNLQHRLSYFTGSTGPPELDARVRIPVDPFDREGLLLGLQSLAELLDAIVDEDMSGLVARIRDARRPAAGAPEPALRGALQELELPATQRADDVWRIETSRGPLDVMLHPEGETWMLLAAARVPVRRATTSACCAGCWTRAGRAARGSGSATSRTGRRAFTDDRPAGRRPEHQLARLRRRAGPAAQRGMPRTRSRATSSRDDRRAPGRADPRRVARRRPAPVARRGRRGRAAAGVAVRRRSVAWRRSAASSCARRSSRSCSPAARWPS